jgi:tryptophanyl-tRNA synthetase
MSARKRVVSGIQSSGKLHLGNFLGAMKQHLDDQHVHECFIFIANYHSLTSVTDAARLRELTQDVALDYLALGLDPKLATLFRQSDVPDVCELTWILATVTGKGLLERATSYKDKVARGVPASMGLFAYPLLMAADILIYRADLVPVGKDQLQHVEMTQDIATHFNTTYGAQVLARPEAKLNDAPIVPGLDGQKMSKSYGNTIDLFDEPAAAKKRIMSIKTDSAPVEAPKDEETCNIFSMYRHLVPTQEAEAMASRYRAGGLGYGEAKKALLDVFERTFGPARERRRELAARPHEVEDILRDGGLRARGAAAEVMERVRAACGIVRSKA